MVAIGRAKTEHTDRVFWSQAGHLANKGVRFASNGVIRKQGATELFPRFKRILTR